MQVVDGLKRRLARPAKKMLPLTGGGIWAATMAAAGLQMLSLLTSGFGGFFR